MSNPYVGEIRMFGGNFAPTGWLFCEGQLLSIAENDVLFNLIGTTYGGDGQNTFALPDLRGRVPVHRGQGPNTSNWTIGQPMGTEGVTLTVNQLPAHTHGVPPVATAAPADRRNPKGARFAQPRDPAYANAGTAANLNPAASGGAGNNQAHDNMQPFLCVHFIISLYGIYPSPT